MQPSAPVLTAVWRVLQERRDSLVSRWTDWVVHRVATDPNSRRPDVEQQFALLVDAMILTIGRLRRRELELWYAACEFHGIAAAGRGLAAGEVVEEMQHLRELLIRSLSENIAALPARQSLATTLRLNRILDGGISHAVVGYTDALVETLFNSNGVPVSSGDHAQADFSARIEQFRKEMAEIEADRENS